MMPPVLNYPSNKGTHHGRTPKIPDSAQLFQHHHRSIRVGLVVALWRSGRPDAGLAGRRAAGGGICGVAGAGGGLCVQDIGLSR